jgi:pimeloyl-ACP methyl ester carboxylesterase
VTDPGAGETLASLVPGARLVIVPQAGHVPWEEAPAATYGALRGFLAESRADPR